MELPLIGYKEYAAESETTGETMPSGFPYITEERGQHGELRIVVPAVYEGYIEVHYKGLRRFPTAEVISLLTIIAVAVYQVGRRI